MPVILFREKIKDDYFKFTGQRWNHRIKRVIDSGSNKRKRKDKQGLPFFL